MIPVRFSCDPLDRPAADGGAARRAWARARASGKPPGEESFGSFGLGELAVPLACAMIGVALIPLSTQLDERSLLATGGALMVLGAVGALLALDSVGSLYPQGVVGLVAGDSDT